MSQASAKHIAIQCSIKHFLLLARGVLLFKMGKATLLHTFFRFCFSLTEGDEVGAFVLVLLRNSFTFSGNVNSCARNTLLPFFPKSLGVGKEKECRVYDTRNSLLERKIPGITWIGCNIKKLISARPITSKRSHLFNWFQFGLCFCLLYSEIDDLFNLFTDVTCQNNRVEKNQIRSFS